MRFTDFIDKINESKDFKTELVFEDEQNDARNRRSGAARITMSLAELYDMTGQPYPMVEDPRTRQMRPIDGLFEPKEYAIGTGDGNINPELAGQLSQWRASGSPIGGMYDLETGELIPYNENPVMLDIAYRLGGATVDALNTAAGGITIAADTVVDTINLPATITIDYLKDGKLDEQWYSYDMYRGTQSVRDAVDQYSESISSRTDQDFQDSEFLFANAVNDVGDIAGLVFGDSFNDLSWQGLFGIAAGELPSELLGFSVGALTGPGGLAAMNAAEAVGAASAEVTSAINALDEAGTLRQTDQYARMNEYAREQLAYQGLTPDLPDYEGSLHELTVGLIQDATISSLLLGTAASGAVLDTIADKAMIGRIHPSVLRNTTGRMTMGLISIPAGATIEGIDEAFQQYLVNRGLINEAGDPRTLDEGVINAAWNGFVIGGAMGAGYQGAAAITDKVRNSTEFQQTQARVRKLLFGEDANNLEAILNIASTSPEALVSRLVDQETGQIDFTRLIDTDIPTSDELTNDQKRRLSRTGSFTTADGQRITDAQIETATRNKAILNAMNSAVYEPDENRWVLVWNDENAMRDAARLFGVEDVDNLSDSEIIRQLESVYNLDMRVPGQDALEAPSWSELTPTQRSEFINDGRVTFKGHPSRGNQTWSRDEVLYSSRRYEDESVPEWAYTVSMPTTPRPSADRNGEDPYEISYLEQQVEISDGYAEQVARENLQRALDNLENDQEAWDSEFGLSNNPDGTPIFSPSEENIQSIRAEQEQVQEQSTPIGSNLARAHVVYNTTLRIANGDMDSLAVASMIDTLEKNYPGIEQEIFGDSGIESYVQNPDEVSEQIDTRIEEEGINPPTPATVENPTEISTSFDPRGVQRPPAGTEIERDGETFRFLGRMWAPVNPDGTLGSTGAVPSQLQKTLRDEWAENTAMSQPVVQAPAPTTQTDITNLEEPEIDTDSGIAPSDTTDETPSAETPSAPPAPEVDQQPVVTDTNTFTPINVSQGVEPAEQDVYDPFRDTTVRDTTGSDDTEDNEQQRQQNVIDPRDSEQLGVTDPRKIEPISGNQPIDPRTEIDTADPTPTNTSTPATLTTTVATPPRNNNNRKKPKGGVSTALQKGADTASQFKAIQLYDPLQLKRSEQYLNK